MPQPFDTDAVFQDIFALVRTIPEGRVTSYGAIAKALGLKAGPRLVGRAMGYAGDAQPPVPVQRVVNSSGVLSGDNGTRRQLLEAEGITVKGQRIVGFRQLFWDPLTELEA